MYAATLLLAAASLASIVVSQSTTSISQISAQAPTRTGTVILTSYSADSPTYTPPPADTSDYPAFSSASSSAGTNYNSTHSPLATASSSPASNYTLATSKVPVPFTFSSVTATSTGPSAPTSSTNAAASAFRRVAGTGLALVVSGSLFSILL